MAENDKSVLLSIIYALLSPSNKPLEQMFGKSHGQVYTNAFSQFG